MKSVSASYDTFLAQTTYTKTLCVKITRTDGVIKGLTNHQKSITFDSVTYNPGFSPTTSTTSGTLAVDNMDIQGYFDDISETDIIAGLYDYAEVRFFEVNYNDLSINELKHGRGWLGEVTKNKSFFIVELRRMAQALQQQIGGVLTPDCPYKLFDSDCGLSAGPFKVTGTLTSATDQRVFFDTSRTEADDLFKYGEFTFTSGDNNGIKREVKKYTLSTGRIETFLPFPFTIAGTENYSLEEGCDRSFTRCKVLNNGDNFGGAPHLTGTHEQFKPR